MSGCASAPTDWRRLDSREHLTLALTAADKALTGAHGGDHLAEACAHLLFALEVRERDRLAARKSQFSADDLRHRFDARRAR
jgi:hypothetical protein